MNWRSLGGFFRRLFDRDAAARYRNYRMHCELLGNPRYVRRYEAACLRSGGWTRGQIRRGYRGRMP